MPVFQAIFVVHPVTGGADLPPRVTRTKETPDASAANTVVASGLELRKLLRAQDRDATAMGSYGTGRPKPPEASHGCLPTGACPAGEFALGQLKISLYSSHLSTSSEGAC